MLASNCRSCWFLRVPCHVVPATSEQTHTVRRFVFSLPFLFSFFCLSLSPSLSLSLSLSCRATIVQSECCNSEQKQLTTDFLARATIIFSGQSRSLKNLFSFCSDATVICTCVNQQRYEYKRARTRTMAKDDSGGRIDFAGGCSWGSARAFFGHVPNVPNACCAWRERSILGGLRTGRAHEVVIQTHFIHNMYNGNLCIMLRYGAMHDQTMAYYSFHEARQATTAFGAVGTAVLSVFTTSRFTHVELQVVGI